MPDHSQEVRAVDMEMGEVDDEGGLGLELTSDDIDDIAYLPDTPIETRIARLQSLQSELVSRASIDLMGDMSELLAIVEERLAHLADTAEGAAELDLVGMDLSSRHDDDDPQEETDEEGEEERASIEPLSLDKL